MKEKIERVPIKPHWDEKTSWYKDSSQPSSALELDAYKHVREFLVRNDSGSLILSGVRGAGKTTTVIEVIRSCEKENIIFPIYLNSIHLEAYGDGDNEANFRMLKVLRLLIRQLTEEVKNKTIIPSELRALIQDCEATTISSSRSSSNKSSINIKNKITSALSLVLQPLQWLGFNTKLESGINTEASFVESNNMIREKTGLTIEDIVDRFSSVIKVLEKRGVLASEISKSRTWTIKILNREIKIIWFKSNKKDLKKKLVFVLDELDVYDGDGGSTITPEDVLSTIKKFKNLFTLSSAHFIFIVGKQTYLKARNDPYRTLFSERTFISVPDGEKLSTYLDTILIDELETTLSKKWDKLKWFMISKSKHNLYDLVAIMRSYSIYDESKHKLYIDIPEIKTIEEAIASFHYLLNAIFVYYKQGSIFEHHNDDLFEELYTIEEVFHKYLVDGSLEELSLITRDTKEIEVNQALRDAKIALLRTLYLFANKKAPDITSETAFAAPWAELRQIMSFDKVRTGISGAITTAELNLITDLETFITDLNNKYSNYLGYQIDNSNFAKSLNSISKLLFVELNKSDIDSLTNALEQINNLPVDKRNWELITQSAQGIKSFMSIFSAFLICKNTYLGKVDWGEVIIDSSVIRLGDDSSHGNKLKSRFTLFLPRIEQNKPIEVVALIKLSQHSLINLLFYREYSNTELESDFYMARLEGRKPEDTYGDCLLHKPKGAAWAIVPDSTVKKTSTEVDKEIEVKVVLNKGILSLHKKKGKVFQLVSKTRFDGECILIGISNEIAPAEIEIKSIKIGNTKHE